MCKKIFLKIFKNYFLFFLLWGCRLVCFSLPVLALLLRVPSSFFWLPAAALRSFLDPLCHLLPLRSFVIPGFFFASLFGCCRYTCINMFVSFWAALVPSWGCLLLGCICCPFGSPYSIQLHCSPISSAAPHIGHIL
jgi:hypothetical protein